MAELLQRLLANTRQNPRRIQYDPFEGFSGPNPGLRGSMPANALDTQDATDMAQGIDIGSVAPTRLRPSPIQMTAYSQDDGGDDEEPSGTPVVQTGQRRVCGENGCFIVDDGMPAMQQGMMAPQILSQAMASPARVLPEGVVEGPGERFVEGSLREVPATAMAPQATAAPPASGATAAPANPSGNPLPFFRDPAALEGEFRRRSAAADAFAEAGRAIPANMNFQFAFKAFDAGVEAANLQLEVAIAEKQMELMRLGMTNEAEKLRMQQEELDAKTGRLTPRLMTETRADMSMPVLSRARRIVSMQLADEVGAKLPMADAKTQTQMIMDEVAKITAYDMSQHMKALIDSYRQLNAARQSNAPEQEQINIRLRQAAVKTELEKKMRDRLSMVPQDQWETALRGELLPAYTNIFRQAMTSEDGQVDEFGAQSEAIRAINVHVRELPWIMRPDYQSPAQRVLAELGVTRSVPQAFSEEDLKLKPPADDTPPPTPAPDPRRNPMPQMNYRNY